MLYQALYAGRESIGNTLCDVNNPDPDPDDVIMFILVLDE